VLSVQLREYFAPRIEDLIIAMSAHRRELEAQIKKLELERDGDTAPAAEKPVERFVKLFLSIVNVKKFHDNHDKVATNL
jgi:hypothetical protein